jgi:hypothetical protein
MFSGPLKNILNRKNESTDPLTQESQNSSKELSMENNYSDDGSDRTPLNSPIRKSNFNSPWLKKKALSSYFLQSPKITSTPAKTDLSKSKILDFSKVENNPSPSIMKRPMSITQRLASKTKNSPSGRSSPGIKREGFPR